jgi:hypothetical protein
LASASSLDPPPEESSEEELLVDNSQWVASDRVTSDTSPTTSRSGEHSSAIASANKERSPKINCNGKGEIARVKDMAMKVSSREQKCESEQMRGKARFTRQLLYIGIDRKLP